MTDFVSRNGITYYDIEYWEMLHPESTDEQQKRKKFVDEVIKKNDLSIDTDDLDSKQLFLFIKKVFETKYNVDLSNVKYKNNFIASTDGVTPIPYNKASRIFSTQNVVYLDKQFEKNIYWYFLIMYMWLKYNDIISINYFQKILVLIALYHRQGLDFSEKEIYPLREPIKKFFDESDFDLISDLYWSSLAFLMCHELAHIYLQHFNSNLTIQNEYEADAIAYDVFLSLICNNFDVVSPFKEVFKEDLYAAPMILFLFFEDLYFTANNLYHEKSGSSHPRIDERIRNLFLISYNQKYNFNTEKGNYYLNKFKELSAYYREELYYKLKNGKLNEFLEKGVSFIMPKNSYDEAVEYYDLLGEEIQQYAKDNNLNHKKVLGLYNIAVHIDVTDKTNLQDFVCINNKNSFRTNAINLTFNLKSVLFSIIEIGLTTDQLQDPIDVIKLTLYILIKVIDLSTIKISDDQAKLLYFLHSQNAYEIGIDESKLINKHEFSQETINELYKLKCLDIIEGKIYLIDTIFITCR